MRNFIYDLFLFSLFTLVILENVEASRLTLKRLNIFKNDITNLPRKSKLQSTVVFIPGDGGSQLEAKLDKPLRVRHFCRRTSDWHNIWLDVWQLTPLLIDCLMDNMRLSYNASSGLSYNSPGVQIRPRDFGSLGSVAYLTANGAALSDYFEHIIVTLETELGLVRDVDMFGAPYDFRKAPNELDTFFQNLTTLIEQQYIAHGNHPVTLICHSMGCLNSLYLLNRKSQAWKDTYVRRLISLAAPWAGSFKALSAMMFGDDFNVPLLDKRKLQTLQSTMPSLTYLLPRPPTFKQNRTLVEGPNGNYSLNNLDQLFEQTELLSQREMWHQTREITASLRPPNVELWCLFGSGIETANKLVFKVPIGPDFTKLSNHDYYLLNGDGDGSVNLESLEACKQISGVQEKPVFYRQFNKMSHIDIVRAGKVAQLIVSQIMS